MCLRMKSGPIPQRLLVRESLASQVRPDEWLPVSRTGIKFYGEFFGVPYPYKKMDLVLVPDFNWGGMENIANITLTEKSIKKGDHTREERKHIAELVLHEVAHMWFGDLVTMRWWDDLWLNESFASLMEGVSLTKTTYPDGWRSFFTGEKLWAYTTDDKVTSHPIESLVNDTSQANSEFDGITYGKGAFGAQMADVIVAVERRKFRLGLMPYFEKHQRIRMRFWLTLSESCQRRPVRIWTSGRNSG